MFESKLITFGLIVAVLMVLITGCSGKEASIINMDDPKVQLAQCLSNSDVILYKTDWCSHCKKQKEAFGEETLTFLNMVDCDEEREKCQEARIEGYPTWIIKGEKHTGVQPLEKLAELSGCTYDGS